MSAREHGTYAMYQREMKFPPCAPCDECRAAARSYAATRRAKSVEAREYDRRYSRAKARALTLLSHMYPRPFHDLMEAELAKAEEAEAAR